MATPGTGLGGAAPPSGTMTKPTAPTPTRKTPRISVQSKGRISLGRKLPINPCMVLNVSAGGALLFAEKPVEEGTV
ncbi:MAG TPA: hypothetical protein VKB76_09540, partial [Ktedonobacterales bacterium]|nr:hypothetical protein [Ktedonobacterales bacterium]